MSRHHRSHVTEFKQQVVAGYHSGETLQALGRRHDLSPNLIRIWIEKTEDRALNEDVAAAELMAEYEARIEALERPAGRQTLEIEFLKGLSALDARREAGLHQGPPTPRALDPAGMQADGRRTVQFSCRSRS